MSLSFVSIGIDVRKAGLDVAGLQDGKKVEHFANTVEGVSTLVLRLQTIAPDVIVAEPSGGYERLEESECETHSTWPHFPTSAIIPP
jgi:hypothetical protein